MGEFESFNFSIGVIPEDIALFHALYRTSIKGRRDLVSMMFSEDDSVGKLDASYTSRVAEIFKVILKSLGISLEFLDEDDEVKYLNDSDLSQHELNGSTYFCTDYQFFIMERIDRVKKSILEENPVLTESKLQEMIEDKLKNSSYINGPLNEEIGDIDLRLKEELDREYEKQKAERLAEEMKKESEELAENLESIGSDI